MSAAVRSRRAWMLQLAALCALQACQQGTPQPAAPPSTPQRIASQTIFSDEVLWSLGPSTQSRVIAVSRLADDPGYSSVAGKWPPRVARSPLTSEALLASEADLVFVADFTAVETRELLARSGVATVTLTGFSGFEDWRTNVVTLAQAVGEADAGRALVERFDTELAAKSAAAAADGPTVVSWAAGNVAGRGTTFDDVAQAAGLRNLAGDQGIVGHKPVTVEQLVAWNPQMLVVPCEGGQDCDAVAARIAEQPGIAATRAAADAAILAVPTRILYSSGWAMLEAVTVLRRRDGAAPP